MILKTVTSLLSDIVFKSKVWKKSNNTKVTASFIRLSPTTNISSDFPTSMWLNAPNTATVSDAERIRPRNIQS